MIKYRNNMFANSWMEWTRKRYVYESTQTQKRLLDQWKFVCFLLWMTKKINTSGSVIHTQTYTYILKSHFFSLPVLIHFLLCYFFSLIIIVTLSWLVSCWSYTPKGIIIILFFFINIIIKHYFCLMLLAARHDLTTLNLQFNEFLTYVSVFLFFWNVNDLQITSMQKKYMQITTKCIFFFVYFYCQFHVALF